MTLFDQPLRHMNLCLITKIKVQHLRFLEALLESTVITARSGPVSGNPVWALVRVCRGFWTETYTLPSRLNTIAVKPLNLNVEAVMILMNSCRMAWLPER